MGALQLQSNGDGAAEGLLPDPGYVEVDPTGRYGRVRSIVFVFVLISPLAFLFLLARLLLPLVDMLRRGLVVDRGTNKSCFYPLFRTTD